MGYTSFSNLPLSAYNELSSKVEDRVYFINDEGTIRLNEVTYGAGGGGGDKIYVEPDYLTFTAAQANSTVALNKSADNASMSAVLEYSTDGETWTNYEWSGTAGTVITLANVGDYVMLRGDNATFSIDNNNYYKFVMTGKVNASGNIMSLLDKTCRKTDLPANYIFTSLFYQCSALYSAPKLPATKLSVFCYNGMFRGCSNLTSTPVLQATTLESGCYRTMFSKCTKLVSAPDLPAKVASTSAYEYMFSECSNLEKGPKISAISINSYTCNSMFMSCRKLNSIKIDFKDLGGTPTMDWLMNVAASGTFYCPYGLDTSTRNASRIPAGWNVVYTDVPESVLSGAAAAAEALTMING